MPLGGAPTMVWCTNLARRNDTVRYDQINCRTNISKHLKMIKNGSNAVALATLSGAIPAFTRLRILFRFGRNRRALSFQILISLPNLTSKCEPGSQALANCFSYSASLFAGYFWNQSSFPKLHTPFQLDSWPTVSPTALQLHYEPAPRRHCRWSRSSGWGVPGVTPRLQTTHEELSYTRARISSIITNSLYAYDACIL